ncbi:hypothetical protein BASA60_008963 [Batrachochytrium salamandrivorans]|nr:hypothetical protein BASA60_008963 [Batrachochytrium salamandrivorans]
MACRVEKGQIQQRCEVQNAAEQSDLEPPWIAATLAVLRPPEQQQRLKAASEADMATASSSTGTGNAASGSVAWASTLITSSDERQH